MFVTCSRRILCCKREILQTRLQMVACETLLPDVVAPKAHQNDRSYVRELSGLNLAHYARILHGGWLHRGPPKKKHKTVKLGGGCLCGDGCLPGTIRYANLSVPMITLCYSNYIDLLWCQLKHVCHVFFRCYAGKLALLKPFFQVV